MKYGLPDRTLSSLKSIVNKYPGIKQVVLYGSRAKGNFAEGPILICRLKPMAFLPAPIFCISREILTILTYRILSMFLYILKLQTLIKNPYRQGW
jgi:hypothetical protein